MPAAKIAVRTQPNARRDELVGLRDGVLQVRVSAPPLEGRANKALCRLLAKRIGVPPSSVTILRGHHVRDKLIQIDGLDQATLEAALRAV